jgi:hypothetical protein
MTQLSISAVISRQMEIITFFQDKLLSKTEHEGSEAMMNWAIALREAYTVYDGLVREAEQKSAPSPSWIDSYGLKPLNKTSPQA